MQEEDPRIIEKEKIELHDRFKQINNKLEELMEDLS